MNMFRVLRSDIPWRLLPQTAATQGCFDFYKYGYSENDLFARITSCGGIFIYAVTLEQPGLPIAATAVFENKNNFIVPFFYDLPGFSGKGKLLLELLKELSKLVTNTIQLPNRNYVRICIACPSDREHQFYQGIFSRYSRPKRDVKNRPLYWYMLTEKDLKHLANLTRV